MRLAHRYFRLAVVLFVMAVQAFVGTAAALFLRGAALRTFRIRFMQKNAAVILKVLGIHPRIEGLEHWRHGQNYLVVGNHLSYVDTLLFSYLAPTCFVSSEEVRSAPVIGRVSIASGALFVERRSRERIRADVAQIANTLVEGFSVAFFPEGTSSNGSSVLRFKGALFQAAVEKQVPVLPVVVQLEKVNGAPVNEINRDLICYHSDMEFFPHLLKLAGAEESEVLLRVLPEILVRPESTREELATQAREAIVMAYRPSGAP